MELAVSTKLRDAVLNCFGLCSYLIGIAYSLLGGLLNPLYEIELILLRQLLSGEGKLAGYDTLLKFCVVLLFVPMPLGLFLYEKSD